MQVLDEQSKPVSERFIIGSKLPTAEDARLLIIAAHPQMLRWAAEHGHGGVVSMDTTFGTNRYGYSLLTATVVDVHGKGKPGLFAVMSNECAEDFAEALKVWTRHVRSIKPGWSPASFIIDDSDAERNGIGYASHMLRRQPR